MVQLGHCLIEGGDAGSASARKLGEVGVGDLAVTDDSLNGYIGVRKVVGPEFVPVASRGLAEDLPGGGGRLALADEEPHQAALGDRAGREVTAQVGQPVLGRRVMDVVIDEQRDEHVGVREDGHCSSSSTCRTSSLVIVLPRCTTGRPVRSLVAISPLWPESSPRRMSSATV